MKELIIKDFKDKEVNWEEVKAFTIDNYPWYESGEKQDTRVKMALGKNNIRLKVEADDKYILAKSKNLNDPVYLDSCFEFFITPWAEKSPAYFNIEINCKGVLYMAYRGKDGEVKRVNQDQADRLTIKASERKAGWALDITIPIDLLEDISQAAINKDLWYGNFYRCGGAKDDQYAAWNPLQAEKPNFHLPMQFGKISIE